LSGKITKAYIRKKYIELIAQYHPDKVFDLGEDLKVLAEIKTKQINAAYDWMKKKYNI
jgi:DnaJ like chaperone protein